MTDTGALRGLISPWAVGSVVVAVAVLVVTLLQGGGAPQPSPAGLPDAGPVTGWGLPVLGLAVDLVGFATVGLALIGSRVIDVRPIASDEALPVAGRLAAIWAALSVVQALLVVSETQAVPLLSTDLDDLRIVFDGLETSPEASALLAQAALAASVVWFAGFGRTATGATITLLVAVAAFVPQTLIGHAATGNRLVGTTSLLIHLVAGALWVGGLAALAWAALRGRVPLAQAIARYSSLALLCLGAVALSGLVNAATRLGSIDALFGSEYGVIVVLKVLATALLAVFGWLHREHTVDRLRAWKRKRNRPAAVPVFVALAAVELTVMSATVALGVGLSRTPTPQETGQAVGTITAVSAASASGWTR